MTCDEPDIIQVHRLTDSQKGHSRSWVKNHFPHPGESCRWESVHMYAIEYRVMRKDNRIPWCHRDIRIRRFTHFNYKYMRCMRTATKDDYCCCAIIWRSVEYSQKKKKWDASCSKIAAFETNVHVAWHDERRAITSMASVRVMSWRKLTFTVMYGTCSSHAERHMWTSAHFIAIYAVIPVSN